MSLQFQAQLEDVQPAVQWATRVIVERPGLAVWAGLHMKVLAGRVTFTGGDGDVLVNATVDGTNTADGEVVVGAKAFNEWLRALNVSGVERIKVTEDIEQRNVVCEAGTEHRYQFRKYAGSYPLPVRGEGVGFKTDLDEFAGALQLVQHATGSGEGPMSGVHVRSTDRRFTITATDSYRMVRVRGEQGLGNFSGILPRKAVMLLSGLTGHGRVWADDEGRMLEVVFGNKEDQTLLSHTLHGPFPSANQVLDSPAEYRLEISREDLLRVLSRVAPFSSKRGVIRVTGGKNTLEIKATSEDVGEVTERMRVAGDASSLAMGLNLAYLRDAVEITRDESVVLWWNQTLGPLRIVSKEDMSVVELIMPVRI